MPIPRGPKAAPIKPPTIAPNQLKFFTSASTPRKKVYFNLSHRLMDSELQSASSAAQKPEVSYRMPTIPSSNWPVRSPKKAASLLRIQSSTAGQCFSIVAHIRSSVFRNAVASFSKTGQNRSRRNGQTLFSRNGSSLSLSQL
ncbi:MAG: hypothetical protein DDT40_01657 [candidate division WS2 bacterium]|nr:hypothetical protein [Candidatus Psychracetigena formicireducens]